MSGRLTPAASTAIRIWPSAGVGRAIRTASSASAGPLPPFTSIAVMRLVGHRASSRKLARSAARPQIARSTATGKGRDVTHGRRTSRGEAPARAEPDRPGREDLELFGADELHERIAALEAEIARVRAQIARKQSTRAAADALFSKRD